MRFCTGIPHRPGRECRINLEPLIELLREAGIGIGSRLHPELEEVAARAPPEESAEAEFAEQLLRSVGINATAKAVRVGSRTVLILTLRGNSLDSDRSVYYDVY